LPKNGLKRSVLTIETICETGTITMDMTIQCCVCSKILRHGGETVSHTYCPECLQEKLAEIRAMNKKTNQVEETNDEHQ
jgi:hypothetical protein